MIHTLPPQPHTGQPTTPPAQVESTRPNWADAQARQAAQKAYPGATVVDISKDAGGKPVKVHVKIRDGSYKTIMLNNQHQITQRKDGYC